MKVTVLLLIVPDGPLVILTVGGWLGGGAVVTVKFRAATLEFAPSSSRAITKNT